MRRTISTLMVGALLLALTAAVATAATRYGTSGPDTLYGTANADRMYGFAGSDAMYAYGGNDGMFGGRGGDRMYAGNGDDEMTGGAGRDVLHSGAGDDSLTVFDGEVDHVYCGAGIDGVNIDGFDKVADSCEEAVVPVGG